MKTVALDTNVISLLLRGETTRIAETLDQIDTFYIPWTVYGELLAGVTVGDNPKRYSARLNEFLSQPFIELSAITATETVFYYADIYAYLRQHGTPVSPNDLWIAAECAKMGLPLYTLDRDFQNIPQVLLV